MRSLFITGTNTGVGKTGVAAAIARLLHSDGRCVGAFKPAVSGVNEHGHWDDVETLADAIDADGETRDRVCPLRFDAPMAPPQAAARQGDTVAIETMDAALGWWGDRCDWLIIEGAGGLLCPMTEEATVADLIARWGVPAVTVVGLELGAINHSLLTAEVLAARGIEHRGWIFNEPTPADGDFEAELRRLTQADIVARSGMPALGCRQHGVQVLLAAESRRPLTAADVASWFG